MEISVTQKTDSGQYACVATTPEGEVKTITDLHVSGIFVLCKSRLNPSMIRKIVDSINKKKKCFPNQYLFCFQTKKNFLFHPGKIFVIFRINK